MHLTLPGRVPSKKNSKRWLKFGRRMVLVPSEQFNAWHGEMMLRIRAKRPKKPFTAVEIAVTFYPPDRIRGDLTNKAESVHDLLVDAGYLEDDNWFLLSHAHQHFGGVDPKNPRAEIEITLLT